MESASSSHTGDPDEAMPSQETHNELVPTPITRSFQSPEQTNAQSIRRIMKELAEIEHQPSMLWTAWPIDMSEPLEWHFTIKGPTGSSFEGGIYHGRLVLPITYPMAPPSIYFLTVNGRFEVHKKVCLSASSYHPEAWQPAWGIRSMLEALHAFFPTPGEGAVHAIDWPDSVRRNLAETSLSFICPACKKTNAQIMEEHIKHFGSSGTLAIGGDNRASQPMTRTNHVDAGIEGSVSKSSPPNADLHPEQPDLEEIRSRRTPSNTHRLSSQPSALSGFHEWMPTGLIFFYWLTYFLSVHSWHGLERRVFQYLDAARWRRSHRFIALAATAILLWSGWVLFRFAIRILKSSFFLFDVPLTRQLQAATNPTDTFAAAGLSVAERTEEFIVHPWIAQLIHAFRNNN